MMCSCSADDANTMPDCMLFTTNNDLLPPSTRQKDETETYAQKEGRGEGEKKKKKKNVVS